MVDTTKSKNEDSRRIMTGKFCVASHGRGVVRPMEPRVKTAMEEITMLGAASNRRMARKKEEFVTWKSEENENNELLEGLYIEEIQGSTRRNIQSYLLVNDIPVSFKLDTGAECNVISLRLANELNAQVQLTGMLLKSFGGIS